MRHRLLLLCAPVLRVSRRAACTGLPHQRLEDPRTQHRVCQDIENKHRCCRTRHTLSLQRQCLMSQRTAHRRHQALDHLPCRRQGRGHLSATGLREKLALTSGGIAMMPPIPPGPRNGRHDPSTPRPTRQNTSHGAIVSLHVTLRHNGTGGGVTAIMQALRPARSRARALTTHPLPYCTPPSHGGDITRGRRINCLCPVVHRLCSYSNSCQRFPCAAPHPSLTLTGERVTFILPLPRTVRGHRDVSRSQKTAFVVSALVMDMASEPQEVCGAATLGHQHGKSRQNTLPMANDAGIHQAEKTQKNRSEDIFVP